MNSVTTRRFRDCLDALPVHVQKQAQDAYAMWIADPHHRSREFKRVGHRTPIYSVRIGLHWRALGLLDGDTMIWTWIGSHAHYDGLISRLR
jgi:hypothetical protein